MALQLKITFTGGGNLGEDFVLDLSEPRLLGRTHSAAVVISKADADVSGRHLEFRAEGDGAVATCLSRNGFERNGVFVREGERCPLKRGDELRLGKRVRLRVDRVGPAKAAAEADAPVDGATLATGATGTGTFATEAVGSTGTFATRAYDATYATRAVADIPSFGGSIVESPIGEAPSVASTRFAAPVATASEGVTADDAATVQDVPTGGVAAPVSFADADTPSFSDATGDGETQAMATRVGNMDVIRAIAEEKTRAKRFRQRLMTVAAFGVLALLGVLAYWRWPRAERWLQHPKPIAQHMLAAPTGATRLYVDYPKNAHTRVSERPGGGVDVETQTGTAQDVPFRLSFDVRRDAAELGRSLEASAAHEADALRKQGYVFEPTGTDRGFGFFEWDYPKSCENGGTQRGLRFYRREFTRSDGTGQWHGVMIYFRDRDTAYRLLREIPDPEWPRGQWLLREDPNIALYFGFLRDQWESPGAAAVADYAARTPADLLKAIDAALERNLPSEWKETARKIDALILVGLKGNADVLSEGRVRLARLRTLRDLFYDECRARGDIGETAEAFAKCWGAFGADTCDLRSRRLSNPKEWRRE